MKATITDLTQNVRSVVESRTAKALSATKSDVPLRLLMPGKMLRTRLAARLFAGSSSDPMSLQAACAATEVVHTASLCHDDVMDNSILRRSLPTLWQVSGPSGAVLVGDLLLCEAMDLLIPVENGRYLPLFLAKVREVVEAEAQQELCWRGRTVDAETCLRLARSKTGPLFAFVASVCGGDDEALCGLLEEVGYLIGTAYQLADDLLDVIGIEGEAGKTLKTDSARGKFTLPQVQDIGESITRQEIQELFRSAMDILSDYPEAQQALMDFLLHDLQPVLERQLGVDMRIVV